MKYLGQFGKAYLETLEQNRPNAYRDLAAGGKLHDHVHQVDRRANEAFQDIVARLMNVSPLPENDLDWEQVLTGIASQARELVMNEILVRDEETAAAEERGFYL